PGSSSACETYSSRQGAQSCFGIARSSQLRPRNPRPADGRLAQRRDERLAARVLLAGAELGDVRLEVPVVQELLRRPAAGVVEGERALLAQVELGRADTERRNLDRPRVVR